MIPSSQSDILQDWTLRHNYCETCMNVLKRDWDLSTRSALDKRIEGLCRSKIPKSLLPKFDHSRLHTNSKLTNDKRAWYWTSQKDRYDLDDAWFHRLFWRFLPALLVDCHIDSFAYLVSSRRLRTFTTYTTVLQNCQLCCGTRPAVSS